MIMNYSFIPPVNDFINAVKHITDIDPKTLTRHINSYIRHLKATITAEPPTKQQILNDYVAHLQATLTCPIKPVINATGIILHTNLGRSPLSPEILHAIEATSLGYTNIEFNLTESKRAYRDDHLRDIFHFITGCEDVIIVNNNAAAVYLITKGLANGGEVIVSRGELIEIGGSFRILDMLIDAGATLVEVGTTNCTRLADYERAITPATAFILKTHTSNFTMSGHTEAPTIEELVALSKKCNIPFVYDAGSGLLKKPKTLANTGEPDISQCIEAGIDLVCFSGDKLMGGVQAGIILGKAKYIQQIRKHPLMRVLRVDKLTISYLFHCASQFRSEKELLEKNRVFAMLSQTSDVLEKRAKVLADLLTKNGIKCKVASSHAQIGGGSLPDLQLPSYEVLVQVADPESLHHKLLSLQRPILCILRQRKVYLDVFTIDNTDLEYISREIGIKN